MHSATMRKKIYLVVGEDSGDALGADLIDAFASLEAPVSFQGLAGPRMRERGMESLFDISAISVMGFSAVAARLPVLLSRIRQTANDIIETEPDIVILIDSPEFCQRVARRVKALKPAIRVIKYICPSVWAWRPERAARMTEYLDHVLAILPFEPELLKSLGGPPATYVGHPLAWQFAHNVLPDRDSVSSDRNLIVLPGSRRSETKLLLPDIARTLEILHERDAGVHAILPAVDHLADEIADSVAGWRVRPEVVTGEKAKQEAFARADAALAASGTVLLELALNRIPMIAFYRLDWMIHLFRHLITGWSAALPNLIADETFVPERVNDMIRPPWFARAIEALMRDGPERQSQLRGFDRMAARMLCDEPPGMKAARTILALADGESPLL